MLNIMARKAVATIRPRLSQRYKIRSQHEDAIAKNQMVFAPNGERASANALDLPEPDQPSALPIESALPEK
jgi:hypothetical protein